MSYGADWQCACGWANLDVRTKCRHCGEPAPVIDWRTRAVAAEAALAAAETQMRAKDEALKPFADIAATLDNGLIPRQYDSYLITTTLGPCRSALAALAPVTTPPAETGGSQ